MADQIVITEKSSQAKDVRGAVGSRYGEILAAEGHLFDLLEPEDVVPACLRRRRSARGELGRIRNIASDGRPILGLDSVGLPWIALQAGAGPLPRPDAHLDAVVRRAWLVRLRLIISNKINNLI
jgi:hypothetical protein